MHSVQHFRSRLSPSAARESSGPAAPQNQSSEAFLLEDRAWLRMIEQSVYQNLENQDFLVADLAAAAGCNENQLQLRLQELIGLTPWDYITQLRLEYARKLLNERKHKNLKDVALASGFPNEFFFVAAFQRFFAILPEDCL